MDDFCDRPYSFPWVICAQNDTALHTKVFLYTECDWSFNFNHLSQNPV